VLFDIQRFSISDGPGIRTTVFLKGCPLRCLWCHNPESQSPEREILFSPERCIGCGWCFSVCPQHCHSMIGGTHVFNREHCIRCGRCAERCYAEALTVSGVTESVEAVMDEVLKDRLLYGNSGGGLTVSGGEPLAQPEFTRALCSAAREAGIHVCLDTSGYGPWESLEALLPFVDLFLYDVKTVLDEHHRKLTGVGNQLILKNLRTLDARGKQTVLRCPLIPGVNDSDEELRGIADLANELKNVRAIDVEPYLPLGLGKSRRLGREDAFQSCVPGKDTVERWIASIRSVTAVPVGNALAG
jgi:pyruvate formate lyase activating enzyme